MAVTLAAGCSERSDDAGESDDEDAGDVESDAAAEDGDEETRLVVHLENEDGDPVSAGVEVTIEYLDGVTTYRYSEDIEDGTIVDAGVPGTTVEPGEYAVRAEGEEFEAVEETVDVDDGEEAELALVLEGASGDE